MKVIKSKNIKKAKKYSNNFTFDNSDDKVFYSAGLFENRENLIEVISTSPRFIGNNAFSGCFYLESFRFDKSPEVISDKAFEYCGHLSHFDFNDTYFIGPKAFQFSGLKKAILGPKVLTVKESTFMGCSKLEEVDLCNVSTLEHHAFSCSALYSIVFNRHLKKIGNSVFEGCIFLRNIVCLSEKPPRICKETFYGTALSHIWVPSEEAAETYRKAKYWSEYSDRIKVIDWEAISEYLETIKINREKAREMFLVKPKV